MTGAGHHHRANVARGYPRLLPRPRSPPIHTPSGPRQSPPRNTAAGKLLATANDWWFPPPGSLHPPAVRDTPPPPGHLLAGGPLRTAVQHRRRGGCPTHAVMQRASRAGGRQRTAIARGWPPPPGLARARPPRRRVQPSERVPGCVAAQRDEPTAAGSLSRWRVQREAARCTFHRGECPYSRRPAGSNSLAFRTGCSQSVVMHSYT